MDSSLPKEAASSQRGRRVLVNMPVGLFAAGMGLAGLGLAWRKASHAFAWNGWPAQVGEGVLAFAALAFFVVAVTFAFKAIRHGDTVRKDFAHPVTSNFFAAISIGIMLFASAALPYSAALAETLWLSGAGLHFILTLILMSRWVAVDHDIPHLSPAWFMPAVGNIIAPLMGMRFGFVELSWFLFSVGFVMWIVLFTIVMYRIVFHPPMPARLSPTLFILIAPPAVGFISYTVLAGGIDAVARVLFYFALFLATLLACRPRLFTGLPFAPSWWAYTFPLDALTLAALGYHEAQAALPAAIPLALLGVSSVVVLYVTVRTVRAAIDGSLFAAH